MSPNLINFITRLLDKNPKTRLGANGEEEVLAHPWFADIDFKALKKKDLEAPFKPPERRERKTNIKRPQPIIEHELDDFIALEDKEKIIENNHHFEGF